MVAIAGSWARYSPEKLLARSMPILNVTLILFIPLVRFLRLFDPVVRRLVGAEKISKEKEVSDQVMEVVEEAEDEGQVDEAQKEMIEAVFEFPKTTAGEIMTPRTEVEGIEVSSDLEKVKQTILSDSHSRIPVYQETVDRIVGVLYIKDLTQFIGDSDTKFELHELMRDPMMVPESKPLGELLSEFKINKVHIAIVLDEYGGTAGLVTIEDIIEELVGEIEDEYEEEQERPSIVRADEMTAEVDARVEIDDANDKLGLNLPEDEDYETIGGYVFSTLGHIPTVGESIELEKARLIVTEAEQNKVKRLRVEFSIPVPVEEPTNGRNGK
jgi:putative hemolysin